MGSGRLKGSECPRRRRVWVARDRARSFARFAALVDDGKLKPLIHEQRFTFDEANEAHALYETKKHTGKIVLTHSSP